MSFSESREITITDEDGGSSISLKREGSTVTIEHVYIYENHAGDKVPQVLSAVDRRALIDFLNMGEYQELPYGERR